MHTKKIADTDLLSTKHRPVAEVINCIRDDRFVNNLKQVSEGIGFGVEIGACLFPSDLDEYDIAKGFGFEGGIEFGTHFGEEIVIDYETAYYYFEKACIRYCEVFPNDTKQIYKYLENYKDKYKIN